MGRYRYRYPNSVIFLNFKDAVTYTHTPPPYGTPLFTTVSGRVTEPSHFDGSGGCGSDLKKYRTHIDQSEKCFKIKVFVYRHHFK